jgi:hypothetical protein
MVDIARSHSEDKILAGLKKLHPALEIAPGKLKDVEVDDTSGNGKARKITIEVEYSVTAAQFETILEDSLAEPKQKRTAFVN